MVHILHDNTIHSENILIQIRIPSSFSNINSNLQDFFQEAINSEKDMINQKKNFTNSRYDIKNISSTPIFDEHIYFIYICNEISFQKFTLHIQITNIIKSYSYLYTQPENIFSLKPKDAEESGSKVRYACKNFIFLASFERNGGHCIEPLLLLFFASRWRENQPRGCN